MLSWEICEIFKKNYSEEWLWTSASKLYLKRDSNTGAFLWSLWVTEKHLFCGASAKVWFWNSNAGVCL